jgi:uncharacterized membrane protein
MSTQHHIRNPFEMAVEQFTSVVSDTADVDPTVLARPDLRPLAIRRITARDLGDALRQGFSDFAAARDDLLFVGLVYPIAGLLLAGLALDRDLLPLVFPLVSGFALIGPLAAVGLYEISRRRDAGRPVSWIDAFGVLRSPALGSILRLGLVLLAVFLLWLAAAWEIWLLTLSPTHPASLGAFVQEVLFTPRGWAMIAIGIGVGFLFAVLSFALSVISVPLLLDRNVGAGRAIAVSLRAVRANPGPMALWGLIVAAGLAAGSLPALVGLIIVVPVFGHATWRLYRKVVTEGAA